MEDFAENGVRNCLQIILGYGRFMNNENTCLNQVRVCNVHCIALLSFVLSEYNDLEGFYTLQKREGKTALAPWFPMLPITSYLLSFSNIPIFYNNRIIIS